ncbi:MAG: twin-arginine translocation signal domain-containing protein, partial [Candidatus Levybacteria bacterium]|nr:twin-arginine translocation signal domain-containing protein [Candidatus Levybacteria bacterium]
MREIRKSPDIPQTSSNTLDRSNKGSTRRQFLKKSAIGLVLATGALLIKDLFKNNSSRGAEVISLDQLPIGPPLEVTEFSGVLPKPELPAAENWDRDRIEGALEKAVKDSLEKGEEVTVSLPYGEIVVDKQITCVIPEGARLNIVGDQRGSRLKLDPKLSDVPKEWGSFATRSILYFKDMEGSIAIDSVQFDGGSKRAGKEGY